jgi:hypothetical protein
MPFINTVFDKLSGNAAWGKLFIGKYNLSLQIPFTLLVSNIVCTYETLGHQGVNFGVELCPQGSIVDGAAMAIGDTGDGCRVDIQVGNED